MVDKSESWWLKLKRAQKHMVDICREAKRYERSHPYEVIRIRQPPKEDQIWLYVLHITRQPDPSIAIMLGDFLYNLRSALDHVIVASVPRSRRYRAFFPIATEDLWETDADGKYVIEHSEARERFESAIQGMDESVKAIVQTMQPYVMNELGDFQGSFGGPRHQLTQISRLENADKHRELVSIAAGVRASLFARVRYHITTDTLPPRKFVPDGAQVFRFNQTDPTLTESEVYVNVDGPAVVKIKMPDIGFDGKPMTFDLIPTMLSCLRVTRLILWWVEPGISDEERFNRISRS